MRTCPVSGEPMVHDHLHGVEVDRSPHGIFLDKRELFEITEAERKRVGSFARLTTGLRSFFKTKARHDHKGEGPPERALPCPECKVAMRVETYRDVWIDRCRAHGIFLDEGELELIVERLKDDPDFLRGMRLRLADQEL